ncbi:Variant SH3 domain containing protein [Trichomonas vaginalis G3]|uniref:Variant SH3 domain containing protein n=1 Tax=Trichomonas vaginalis (strain ATCC PRA-98 / G3) TaxID=412133 RepID=A2G3Q9_TRIV3|nr:peroxisomal membrane protein PEX13 family [Trichomonas vaginalis G3]EAX88207.1 Variant SH3 domain containing protein [Trichomonas vaginalis G3]KAI5504039.1 peroxisomal membrane protein PEX13 family [Trichomonas vaginalis G3]|eukprot:XP_001301137.1 Variant SH3 domain containing protein [Trichomonas vaginalis G3]
MESYDAQFIQFNELTAEFHKFLDTEENLILHTKSLIDILEYCCDNYNSFLANTSQVMFQSLTKSVLVFSENSSNTEIFNSQYQRLLDIYAEISAQIILMIKRIHKTLVPQIKDAVREELDVFEDCKERVSEIEKNYLNRKTSINNNVSMLKGIAKDIASAKKKNDVFKLTPLVKSYVQIYKSTKVISRNLNLFILKYNKEVQKATEAFKNLDTKRSQIILNFILDISTEYEDSFKNYTSVYKAITEKYSKPQNVLTGEDYVKWFIHEKNLFRTMLSDAVYKSTGFQFEEDPDILIRSSHIEAAPTDYPIYVAKAKYKFDSKGQTELSFLPGDTLYLYEKPSQMWILASKNGQYPQGYIPSSAITILEKKFCYSLVSKAYDNDYLGIAPGMCLVIENNLGDTYICTNPQGKQGKVKKSDVVIC